MSKSENALAVARLALQLVGFDLSRVDIFAKPIICRDDEGKFHRTENAVEWHIVDAGGVIQRHGFVTRRGRVTEFSHEKNFTGQKVLPFGGSWESEAETQYRHFRWVAWNARG